MVRAPVAVDVMLFAVLAVFIQMLVPHKFVGWLVMLLVIVAQIVLAQLGYEHNLYQYASAPAVPLSDMNGQGHFAGVRGLVSRVLERGRDAARGAHLRALATRPSGSLRARLRGAAAPSSRHSRRHRRGRRSLWPWRRRLHLLQHQRAERVPDAARQRAVGGGLREDAAPVREGPAAAHRRRHAQRRHLPERASVSTRRGDTRSRTAPASPLGEVHVRWMRDTALEQLELPARKLRTEHAGFNYRIYAFETPLDPGARVEMRFSTVRAQRGFRHTRNQTDIVDNGTFINNTLVAPFLGMGRDGLLQDRAKRRKYGLPPELRPPKLEDESARANHYLRHDSDWVNADITVSTDADQLAIAPGYQVSENVANGRRVVRYRTDAPIMHFFSIQSAAYAMSETAGTT